MRKSRAPACRGFLLRFLPAPVAGLRGYGGTADKGRLPTAVDSLPSLALCGLGTAVKGR